MYPGRSGGCKSATVGTVGIREIGTDANLPITPFPRGIGIPTSRSHPGTPLQSPTPYSTRTVTPFAPCSPPLPSRRAKTAIGTRVGFTHGSA